MHYEEFSPPPSLERWVKCAWVFEADRAHDAPERIVPDGRPELVVHWKAPFAELVDHESARIQPAAVLAGQLTRPLHLRGTGPAGVVGVRFHPDGARAFYGQPMRAAVDRRIPLDDWMPGATGPLRAAIAMAPNAGLRAEFALEFVGRRIAAVGDTGDATVRAAVVAIEAGEGDVEKLADDAGLGRRQLERRFADAVGVGPGLLASVLRFRRVFDVIEHGGARPWTEASLAAGYYDQSHFIREFRRFVGCKPSEFFRRKRGLAEALVQG